MDDKRRSQELLNGKIINGWVGIAIKYALILKTKEKLTMDLLKSIFYFVLAGLFEIGGGYLIWLWLRDGKNIWYGLIGAIALIIYGVIPTLQPPSANFGRVYAAYGGIFIVLSIIWGWKIDNVLPDKFDLIGGFIALIGVLIIMYYPRG
ncbi:membrane protein [Clostridium sp. L74]|nr:membrane protein [Clostridium sp. L74]